MDATCTRNIRLILALGSIQMLRVAGFRTIRFGGLINRNLITPAQSGRN
jgi:hypothetical protein